MGLILGAVLSPFPVLQSHSNSFDGLINEMGAQLYLDSSQRANQETIERFYSPLPAPGYPPSTYRRNPC